MAFDLEGTLKIDYSALDGLETEIQSRTEGTEAAVEVDTSSADAALSDLEGQLKDVQTLSTQLGRVVSKEHLAAAESTAQWDAAMRRLTVTERDAIALWQQLHETAAQPLGQQAAANLRIVEARMGDVLATAKTKLDVFLARTTPTEERPAAAADVGLTPGELVGMGSRQIPMTIYGVRSQIMTDVMGAIQTMLAGGDRSGMLSRFTSGRTGLITGGALAVGGGALSASLISGSLQAAQAEKMMAKSTEMVFGTAASEYDDQAHALADSTGFMVAELQQAQIAFNKMALTLGMENAPQKPLTQLVTDLASNTGLPQYANNIQAVTNAVASGIGGAADALLDFGISLDDAYVLSLAVNRGFKAMGEAITPAQMAQARYNALMEQTAGIYGTAGETADDAGASMRRFQQSLQGAKASVGEVLLPIANTIADFVANIPKPLLKAGIWAGIGIGLASTVAGAVIAIASLKRAVQDLGIAAGSSAVATSAAATATNTTTSATGKLSGGVGNLGKAAGVAAIGVPLLVDAINQLISGLQNEENYYENSYTKMLNTIQDDEGGPGWWDKILTYSKKGALGPGFAALAHALGPTQTEMNKEWADVGGPKQADTLFQGWLADAMGMTGSQRAEFKSAPVPTYVDLPGGAIKPEPFTYEGLKEWWQTNQMDTIKQSGVEVLVPAVTIKVENNTDAIIATDLNSYTESIY